jgi:uncharacterized protein
VKSIFLLDVNVLIAAAWPTHHAHAKVQAWLAKHAIEGWATCPLTELAFVRILSNPAFSPHALTPRDAVALLRANLSHPAHHFWADELAVAQAMDASVRGLTGHLQLTDAYLLALAKAKRGKVVTLDQGMRTLLGNEPAETGSLIVI